MKYASLGERINTLVNRVNGCWEWQGYVTKTGYGRIQIGSRKNNSRKVKEAHIVSYETFVGKIPEGLVLDHLCRNRKCVNPSHLEPVTFRENIARGEAGKYLKERTHCPAGHSYSGENLLLSPKGYRRCRTCVNTQSLKYYYQKSC